MEPQDQPTKALTCQRTSGTKQVSPDVSSRNNRALLISTTRGRCSPAFVPLDPTCSVETDLEGVLVNKHQDFENWERREGRWKGYLYHFQSQYTPMEKLLFPLYR